jgi:hypothetical protein
MIISVYAIPGKQYTEPLPSTLNRLRPDEMVQQIKSAVLHYFEMTPDEVFRKCRKRELVLARQIMHYLAKKYTSLSLIGIGAEFPHKLAFDHTSVRHSIETVLNLMETDANVRSQVNAIEFNMGCDHNERVVIVTNQQQIKTIVKKELVEQLRSMTISEHEKVMSKYS